MYILRLGASSAYCIFVILCRVCFWNWKIICLLLYCVYYYFGVLTIMLFRTFVGIQYIPTTYSMPMKCKLLGWLICNRISRCSGLATFQALVYLDSWQWIFWSKELLKYYLRLILLKTISNPNIKKYKYSLERPPKKRKTKLKNWFLVTRYNYSTIMTPKVSKVTPITDPQNIIYDYQKMILMVATN